MLDVETEVGRTNAENEAPLPLSPEEKLRGEPLPSVPGVEDPDNHAIKGEINPNTE